MRGHGKRCQRILIPANRNSFIRKIPLPEGLSAIVDVDDFERFGSFFYHLVKGAAMRHTPDGGRVFLHREIMNAPDGTVVDHINGIRLDNRKANLRICSNAQNSLNRKLSKANKSGYTGVYWIAKTKMWLVNIKFEGEAKYLGTFRSKKAAIERRRTAELKYFGEYAPKQRR